MKVTCIKTITTKKGVSFIKGQNYENTIDQNRIRIFSDSGDSIVISNKKIFNKYFS